MRPLLCLSVLASLLPGQLILNRPRPAATFSIDVELVNVLCTVRDRKGAFVRGLNLDDFEVKDEGKRQPIRSFARDVDTPLTIALLIDVSGSVAALIPQEKEAGERFFRSVLREGDTALLAGFAGRTAIWQEFTGNITQLLTALEGVSRVEDGSPPARGGTVLFDAVRLVASQRLKERPGRKTMIVISDGIDAGSLANLEDAVRAAHESDAVVYAIHYEENGGRTGVGPLSELADETGGRVFEMGRGLDLKTIFDMIEAEMRSQYSLGIRPSDGVGDDKFRQLEVRVKKPGVKVQARRGYYRAARPEAQ